MQGVDAEGTFTHPVDPLRGMLQPRCGNRTARLLGCNAENIDGRVESCQPAASGYTPRA